MFVDSRVVEPRQQSHQHRRHDHRQIIEYKPARNIKTTTIQINSADANRSGDRNSARLLCTADRSCAQASQCPAAVIAAPSQAEARNPAAAVASPSTSTCLSCGGNKVTQWPAPRHTHTPHVGQVVDTVAMNLQPAIASHRCETTIAVDKCPTESRQGYYRRVYARTRRHRHAARVDTAVARRLRVAAVDQGFALCPQWIHSRVSGEVRRAASKRGHAMIDNTRDPAAVANRCCVCTAAAAAAWRQSRRICERSRAEPYWAPLRLQKRSS
jgi:hypothetical protein